MKVWRTVLVVVVAASGACGTGDDATVTAARSGDALSTEGWRRAADPPLSPRQGATAVWTGAEVIVVGGDTALCPPTAGCARRDDELLADGAAYDPAADGWRAIAPAPVPVYGADSAVIDGDVYLFAGGRADPALLRYRVGDDRWDTLDLPDEVADGHAMVRFGDQLLFSARTHELGARTDVVLDPETGTTEPLPPDPLAPSYARTVVAVGDDLVLLAHDLVPNPGSERPSLVRTARFDAEHATWTQGATSQSLDPFPVLVDGSRVIVATLGGADGGQVNNWGRTYPYGGVYDVAADTWSDLPPTPATTSAGAVGHDDALFRATSGALLDAGSGRWMALPPIPGDGDGVNRHVVAAGRAAFVVGGARWQGSDGTLLADAWLWEPPAAAGITSTSTTTSVASRPADPEPGDPAVWDVDPAAAPVPDRATFTALVTRLGCSGGVTGTVLRPGVVVMGAEVAVTFTVETRTGGGRCPGNDQVPYVVDLGEPLGERAFVDGACRSGAPAATRSWCEGGTRRWPPTGP